MRFFDLFFRKPQSSPLRKTNNEFQTSISKINSIDSQSILKESENEFEENDFLPSFQFSKPVSKSFIPQLDEEAPTSDSDLQISPTFKLTPSTSEKALAPDFPKVLFHELRAQPFEKFCLELLILWGFRGQLTAVTGDHGIDIYGQKEIYDASGFLLFTHKIVCQCKGFEANSSVGSPMILEFAGAMVAEKTKKGFFFTSAKFTTQAKETRERLLQGGIDIELFDRERLLALQSSLFPTDLQKNDQ